MCLEAKMKVCVIGGGPAGMMTAIQIKKNSDYEVWLYEKNKEIGKKLNITR